jgi:hypothetical protein
MKLGLVIGVFGVIVGIFIFFLYLVFFADY